jgi:hypothetical protein
MWFVKHTGARHCQVSHGLPGVLLACLLACCTLEACITGTAFSPSAGLHGTIVSYEFCDAAAGYVKEFQHAAGCGHGWIGRGIGASDTVSVPRV